MIKQWLKDHHSAILATLVAMTNLPFLSKSGKMIIAILSAGFDQLI
jgi:hypothetical protein